MKVLIFGSIILGSSLAFSSPVVEVYDRFEMNWGSLRVKFFGESRSDGANQAGYQEKQQMAWGDGLAYVSNKISDVRKTKECWDTGIEPEKNEAERAFDGVSKSTYSTLTTYFGEGSIRIQMESSLTKALFPAAVDLDNSEPGSTEGVKHTGVILEISEKKQVSPCPTYTLVDESGEVLFDSKRVWKAVFEKNFMARWYQKPSKNEVRRYVGDNPLKIPVTVDDRGRFSIDRVVWEQVLVGNEPLLSGAKVLIASP